MVLRLTRLVAVALGVATSAAGAGPRPFSAGTRLGGSHVLVVTPSEGFSAQATSVSKLIYLNRCAGGCMVTQSNRNDARNHLSTMIKPGTSILTEFASSAGEVGSAADAEWAQVVQCLREVYSPFDVAITDQHPSPDQTYTELMIAGLPTELGFAPNVLGVAPVHIDCNAYDNAIAFAFANQPTQTNRVLGICWTAAQEAAHNFGLDHQFQFVDGESACSDPTTYRTDCGGQKFFRDKAALCGETAIRQCLCSGNQNSHHKLLGLLGAGTPITGAPTVSVLFPAEGVALAAGQVAQVKAKSQRGVARVELWLNDHKWTEVAGAPFGPSGQEETIYTLAIPARVPDGVIDIVAKAFDDLGTEAESAVVMATKGAPCATSESCLTGQKCQAGKCFWEPAAGALGATCSYNEYCVSGLCVIADASEVCTQKCIVSSIDACPIGFDCVPTDDVNGVCLRPDSGGCCRVGRGANSALAIHGGLGALVLATVVRRRRRRGEIA